MINATRKKLTLFPSAVKYFILYTPRKKAYTFFLVINYFIIYIPLINATNDLVNATNIASKPKLAFLHTLFNPTLIAIVLPILFVTVLIIFVVRNVTPVSHFLYANARIQARSNYVVSDQLFLDLTEAKSLGEFRSLLRETSYGAELEKVKEDLRSFHAALEKSFINSILELVELSPEKSKLLFNAYLMFFETKILKIIYRARFMKMEIDESLVYPIGNANENLLKNLLGTESIADVGVVMEQTMYAEIFEKEYPNLEEFEVKIDEFVLSNFVGVVEKTKMYDGKYIIDILNKKIDILNILALLKFRVRGIEREKQKELLINNKTDLCSIFDRLIGAEKLEDFIDVFKGMPYYEPLKKALEKYNKDNALSHFENGLYLFFKKFVVSNELSHTLGPYPLFSYLIKRELELRNLFVISRGIDAGFSTEKMREMIV